MPEAGMHDAYTLRRRQSLQKDADLRRQVRRINALLLVVLAALIVGPIAVGWLITSQVPYIEGVTIDNARVVGSDVLCPGDSLVVEYDLHARGAGLLVRDRTLWRLLPTPRTVVFSESQRFILMDAIDQRLTDAWHIPATYRNPETDRDELLPSGSYKLLVAVSSPTRSAIISMFAIDVEIREDCHD